jgi:hypothetical protein
VITLQLGENKLSLPTDWNELTLNIYLKLLKWDKKDFAHLIEQLTGSKLIRIADLTSLASVVPYLDWLKKPFKTTLADLPDMVTVDEKQVRYPLDISKEPFQCKMYMQKNYNDLLATMTPVEAYYEAIPFTLACYLYPEKWNVITDIDKINKYQDVILQMKMIEAVPLAEEYHRQNILLTQRWNKALNSQYENNELRAGIKGLEKFGIWGTGYNLGGLQDFDKVMQLPYSHVFLSLVYEKQKREYQRKLEKIVNRKHKVK